MEAHEAETKSLREMRVERTQKTIAKMIWGLKKQYESDVKVTAKGSIADVLTGLKYIFDSIIASCAVTKLRKEMLAMLEKEEEKEAAT